MKVTKAKALNAKPFTRSARCGTAPGGPPETPLVLIQTLRQTRPRVASAFGPAFGVECIPSPADRAGCSCDAPRCLRWPAGRGSEAGRTNKGCCIEPLCFGDFHLGPQLKVTRPPGRDPAGNAVSRAILPGGPAA